jgi:hypothetical protein
MVSASLFATILFRAWKLRKTINDFQNPSERREGIIVMLVLSFLAFGAALVADIYLFPIMKALYRRLLL